MSRRTLAIGVVVIVATGIAIWVARSCRSAERTSITPTGGAARLELRAGEPEHATIVGTVTPSSVVEVTVIGNARDVGNERGEPPRTLASDATGAFRFDVEPGQYCVLARGKRGAGSRCGIEVSAKERKAVTIALEPQPLALRGVVRDGGGGTIGGAFVIARRQPLGDRALIAISDANGAYELALAAGDYQLEAGADGYAPVERFATIIADAEESFALMPAGTISGVVTDHARVPVAGAQIRVHFETGYVARATSAADGTFELRGLPTAAFHIVARGERSVADAYGRLALGEHEKVALALGAGVTVKGRVRWRGSPTAVAGATVVTGRADGKRKVTTAGDGAFELTDIVPGELPLTARFGAGPETYEKIPVGSKGRDDVVLELAPSGVIEGRVVTARGAAVADADVAIDTGTRATTDATGMFRADVVAGSVHVIAKHASEGMSDPTIADVAAGKTVRVDLVLGGDARILGAVKAPSGAPVPNTKVTISAQSARLRWEVATDGTGEYRINGLRPGHYRVEASPRGASEKFVTNGAHKTVQVAANTTVRVDLVALVGDRKLAGRVVDSKGAAVAGALVWAEREGERVSVSGGPADATAYSLPDGNFELVAIPDGTYTLGAAHVDHGRVRATNIKADARDAKIAFAAVGSISGTVKHTNGAAVDVFILDWQFQDGARFHNSRQRAFVDGVFQLDALPPAWYQLTATTAAGESGETPPITIAPGETKRDITITVIAPGGIRGRIIDRTTKQPLGAAEVDSDGGSTKTDASGRFLLDRVPAGSARPLRVRSRNGSSRSNNARFDVVVEPGKITDVGDFAVSLD